MNIFPAELRELLRAAYYLGRTGSLSWQARGAALERVMRIYLRRLPKEASIPWEGCPLFFDLSHRPDWRVYREVFVRSVYAARYEGSTVVDIGAHRGLFSAFALHEGCAAVLAYEPEPANFAYLERNAESFSKAEQKVHARRCAVGSESGKIKFFSYDESWSHSVLDRADRKAVAEMEVDQVSFGDVVAEAASMAAGRILVKIDAEGAEYDMLQNASYKTLSLIDELFVETHDYASGDPDELALHLATNGLTERRQRHSSSERYRLLHFIGEARRSAASRQG